MGYWNKCSNFAFPFFLWVYNKEHLEIDIMEVVLIIVNDGVVEVEVMRTAAAAATTRLSTTAISDKLVHSFNFSI